MHRLAWLPLSLLAVFVPVSFTQAQSELKYWPSPSPPPASHEQVHPHHTPYPGLYGQPMYYGHTLNSATLGSVYQGYAARRYARSSYRYRLPVWHDTTHLDYHAPSYYRHGNHYHYMPGHYDVHHSGHWDVFNPH